MKINEFAKSQQLLIFIDNIEEFGNRFSLGEYGDSAINYGIATSKKNLSSILSNLKKKQWIMNYANGYWELTPLGMHYVDKLLLKLDDNSWFSAQPKENKKVKQPNSFENSAPVDANSAMKTAFESMAQSFNSMAQSFNSLGISFNKQNDSNVKDLLDSSYQLACNNDAYIAFIISHIDTVVNAIRNGTKSPKEIIETLMEIYSDGINPLVKNNSDLKNMLSPE